MTRLTDQDVLRAVLDRTGLVVFAYDAEGTITMAQGKGHEVMCTESPEAMLGQSAFSGVRHDLVENIEHLKLALTGEKFTAIGRYNEDGLYLERSFTPTLDQSGKVVEVLGVGIDVTERERAIRERDVLIAVGKAMSEKTELETLLGRVAHLMIPALGDYCTIDLADEDGRLRQSSVAHADPILEDRLFELQRRYSHDIRPDYLPFRVLRSRETVLISQVTDDMLVSGASDERELELFRALAPRSCVLIPLLTGGCAFGVLTLAWSTSTRRYSERDLPLLEELARRVALAVDYDRLSRIL